MQDKSYLHNYLMFNLARQVGDYASRTQFCELFIKERNDQVKQISKHEWKQT